MAIFQKSVIKKHLRNLNKQEVGKAYIKFKHNFNPAKIARIETFKEEIYQDRFIQDLFIDVLGYTLNIDADDFNIIREYKNQTDAKKADGTILKDGKVLAVIELKSSKTKILESIKDQAFGYKNNQKGCKYVITSNFKKIRFYIDNATEYEEFNLFQINESKFKILYLILNRESILSDLPITLKEESKFHEDDISAQLYKDYKHFKDKIFDNLLKNNPQYDKLTLFKKSQKLLDRFLFVLFAEDSGFIPPNTISKIIEQWKILQESDEHKPLYSRFQKLFSHLDKGHTYKEWGEIPAYNGGLFREDEILDSPKIIIDDVVLEKDSLKLSAYDFSTEVDVNILGHIFEHSLTEIEEVIAEIEADSSATKEQTNSSSIGTDTNSIKKTSKRKKDGVFYTPKYISQYIIENTIGKLCEEKRMEMGINFIEINDSHYLQRPTKGLPQLSGYGMKLYDILNGYKKWLLTLKILDPACGSGAFLNQALSFLIAEHKIIDDYIAELTGDTLCLFDTDKAILENNLYGVDINEESVEITKLSLWLRTAQKGRELSNLNNNIKCGDSLIDDPKVAGKKAFNWAKEFPKIFKQVEKKAWRITFTLHDEQNNLETEKTNEIQAIPTKEKLIRSRRKKPSNLQNSKLIDGKAESLLKSKLRASDTTIYSVSSLEARVSSRQLLTNEQELILAEELSKIAVENGINILACNICGNRVDIIIVCEEGLLNYEAGKWKGRTSSAYYKRIYSNDSLVDNQTEHKLWTKGYNPQLLKDDVKIEKTINGIQNSREKEKLPKASKELRACLDGLCCTKEHAFDAEYNGGFDVVIGNPPYVNSRILNNTDKSYYHQHFKTARGRYDLYTLFIEKSLNILKKNKYLGFIIPNKFLITDYGLSIRKYIFQNSSLIEYKDFSNNDVFMEASVYPVVIILNKKINPDIISDDEYNLLKIYSFEKNETVINKLDEITDKIQFHVWRPIATSKNIEIGNNIIISNREVNRYSINTDRKGKLNKYRDYDIEGNKLLIKKLSYTLEASYDEVGFHPINTTYCIKSDDENLKYILCCINSKLLSYYVRKKYKKTALRDGYIELRVNQLKMLPIKQSTLEVQQPFIEKTDNMLGLNKALQSEKRNFLLALQEDKGVPKLTKKLNSFNTLEYDEFEKELHKQKIKISPGTENNEWHEYFTDSKNKVNIIEAEISKLDAEIDAMVYELYGLSEEEITIVENK